MRNFAACNPIAVTACVFAAAGIAMFSMDPVVLALSLAGALGYFLARSGLGEGRSHLYTLALFAVMALINPLTYHNGVTVLFVMNNNPVTLEATLYGLAAAGMVVTVLYWFRSYAQIMTSDRLLYLFGSLSPRLALILSMAMRYVPLFGQQAGKVRQAQKALGLFKEDNIVDTWRGNVRVFSVMVTWALENGIVTADSMTARGYGVGKRSRFSLFRFTGADLALVLAAAALTALTLWGLQGRGVQWYPAFVLPGMTLRAALGYAAYGLLAFLPLIMDAKEALVWRCLRSSM